MKLRWSRDLPPAPNLSPQGSLTSCRSANWPGFCMAFSREQQAGLPVSVSSRRIVTKCRCMHGSGRGYPLRRLPHILGGAIPDACVIPPGSGEELPEDAQCGRYPQRSWCGVEFSGSWASIGVYCVRCIEVEGIHAGPTAKTTMVSLALVVGRS